MTGAPGRWDVFLDLDGTLTDPLRGFVNSVTHALVTLGHPVPPHQVMIDMIGPPLGESFAALGVADSQEALALYRQRYGQTGMFENDVYPGIPQALEAISARGHRLVLMTAKPHVFATRITRHFGLDQYLSAEYGPELDGRFNDKAELLARALGELDSAPERSVMVGDRDNDIRAARANGIASVAACWGHGSEAEWQMADYRIGTAVELPGLIDRLTTR